jgi:hypothetical protein
MKYVMNDIIASVEEKCAKQWMRGVGKDAEFADKTEGWYATFKSCPASIYLGTEKPVLSAGDRVRITLERV